ncbi:MAG TPA: PqqD family protein [bacterium]|nr:PqqD family protein [bacterium]
MSTTVVRGEGHLHTELSSEETVVLGADLEHYFGLNSVAARVWQLLETPMTVNAICSVLLTEFEVDRPTCESQTLELIERLSQECLIEAGDEAM